VRPKTLFNKIIKNSLKAQCVCPGEFVGLKFNLNSEDNVFNIKDKVNLTLELDNQ